MNRKGNRYVYTAYTVSSISWTRAYCIISRIKHNILFYDILNFFIHFCFRFRGVRVRSFSKPARKEPDPKFYSFVVINPALPKNIETQNKLLHLLTTVYHVFAFFPVMFKLGFFGISSISVLWYWNQPNTWRNRILTLKTRPAQHRRVRVWKWHGPKNPADLPISNTNCIFNGITHKITQ